MTRHSQRKATRRSKPGAALLVDFAFITAIEVERKAVCKVFALTDKHRVRRDVRVYWRGSVALPKGESYEIVVAQPPDMAQVDAAILTNDAIHHWDPGALLLVGVAGAASDGSKKDDAGLGDLVFARDVYYYERGKVTAKGKHSEPTMYRADAMLWNNVMALPLLNRRISIARPDGREVKPTVHHGVIASGEKVIADAAVRDEIARDHRKISAIEMEGYGFSAAVWQSAGSHRHLVMKAICDRADRDKTQDWQPYAAAVAAQYARHFLKDRPLEPRNSRRVKVREREHRGRLPRGERDGEARRAAERKGRGTANLPAKAYHELIGRQREIDQVIGALTQDRTQVIAVVGLGGIGKTALVREVVERCYDSESFKYIVWESFKTELFVGERVTGIERFEYSFDELLGDILRQHTAQMPERKKQEVDVKSMTADQKLLEVGKRLRNDRVLVVLDNLETVPDGERLVARLGKILGPSKLLVTSRHQLKHEVFNLELGGLAENQGVAFLRTVSQARGVEAVSGATRTALVKIHSVTGGAPLAMKLVIGQMSRQPMLVVLKALQEAAFRGQDYEFYHFIFRYSWQNLRVAARMALVDMSVFPPKGGAIEDVQSISQVKGDDFWRAMDELVGLSLVEKSGKAGEERFALHPLTQNFVRSDITKEWERRDGGAS